MHHPVDRHLPFNGPLCGHRIASAAAATAPLEVSTPAQQGSMAAGESHRNGSVSFWSRVFGRPGLLKASCGYHLGLQVLGVT